MLEADKGVEKFNRKMAKLQGCSEVVCVRQVAEACRVKVHRPQLHRIKQRVLSLHGGLIQTMEPVEHSSILLAMLAFLPHAQ